MKKRTANLYKNHVFFAGSWAPRYKERSNDTKMLFDGVLNNNSKLIIADRNYYIFGYDFPLRYQNI